MKPLDIVHVTPYFAPAWAYGGIPRLAYELARRQGQSGHKVKVITTDVLDSQNRHPDSGATISLDEGAIEARYLRNMSNRLAYDHQLFIPSGARKAFNDMASAADIIHIHGHRHYLELAASKWAAARKISYVITANGTTPRIERKGRVKAMLDVMGGDGILKNAAACVAVTKSEIPQYIERGVSRKMITVIPNPIDVEAFTDLPPKGTFLNAWNIPGDPVVLYLGKITPRKGLVPLVRAMNKLRKNRRVRLVIAGNDMGYVDRVHEEVNRLDMNDMVTFTGLLKGRDKRAAYVDADVTVYPSRHEIFGLVPFEAILCGSPVVVSDDLGCGEIVGEADMGETVPYGDETALADSIAWVLDHPKEAKTKVERGDKFIKENLELGVVARRTVELYRMVLDGGFPGR